MSRLPASFAKHLKPVRRPETRPPSARNGIEEALRRANEHAERGEIGQAEKLCVAILARDPRNVPALMLAGALARDRPEMRILLMSGYSDLPIGGLAFLQKPFGPKDLARKVREVLDRTA